MAHTGQAQQIPWHKLYRMLVLAMLLVMVSMQVTSSVAAQSIPSLEQTLTEFGRTLPTQTSIVNTVSELVNAVQLSNSTGGNRVILIDDGEYRLNNMLYITADNVTFRSRSGNRDAVVLQGAGMSGSVPHIFLVTAINFTVSDLTLGWVKNHGIQIQGEQDADAPLIHNVRFVDTYEQMLKVSYRSGDSTNSDSGIVEYSLFEYTSGVGPQYYIGGIDAHQAHNWVVRNNVFRHIRSPERSLAEHAIHFWSESQNTVIENNVIVNCDRGIGFGLGDRGHIGGLIRNNMVHTTRDAGIGLENSSGTLLYNNTVFTENYFNSIEYRFPGTNGGQIVNNVTNAGISSRNGGSASVRSNVTNAQASWFVNAGQGDLHLASSVPTVVDQGETLPDVNQDIDGQTRPQGMGYDIGADEIGGVQPVQYTLTVGRAGNGGGAV